MTTLKTFVKVLLCACGCLFLAAAFGCTSSSNTQTSNINSNSIQISTESTASNNNASHNANGYREISQDEAKNMMRSEHDYIILDVRRDDEFSTGHIPEAINIPVETIEAMSYDDKIAELSDKDQLVMVYCRTGRRSKIAAEKLSDMGFTAVVEFGGITTWTGDITTS